MIRAIKEKLRSACHRMAAQTVALLVLALLLMACPNSRQTQAVAADVMARTINAALPVLVAEYDKAGNLAIDDATSAEDARAKVAKVKQAWAPVWRALELFEQAHSAWADALERDEPADALASDAVERFCSLRDEATRVGVNVPDLGCGP